jgi:pentatricopeptide repeat-containing protein PET309
MPYLRDKYQGALLRDREPFANKLPSPINILTTRTGALGINGKPKFRDRSKAEEPFDLEFLTTPNPIDEKNITQLLPDEERDKLGSLASVLPRADRMNLEQQFHEYTKVTNFQTKRQLRIQKIIGRAHGKRKNKGLVHGIPVRAFVNKYLLKRNTVESIFFDRYNCRWKSKPDNSHLLFRSVTGLRERHRPEIYSARGTLKRRGIGRMRMKRRDEPTQTPEEWAAKARSKKDKTKHLQVKQENIPQADEPDELRL